MSTSGWNSTRKNPAPPPDIWRRSDVELHQQVSASRRFRTLNFAHRTRALGGDVASLEVQWRLPAAKNGEKDAKKREKEAADQRSAEDFYVAHDLLIASR
jgi:hypothetical protein